MISAPSQQEQGMEGEGNEGRTRVFADHSAGAQAGTLDKADAHVALAIAIGYNQLQDVSFRMSKHLIQEWRIS